MLKFNHNRAFVLLYAVLVASVVLAIGFSLANIITKQIILSSLGQSSRIAYYAADGGRDCGLFWTNFSGVITATPFGSGAAVRCGMSGSDGTAQLISKVPPDEAALLSLYGIDISSYTYQAYSLPKINFPVPVITGGGVANLPACAKVTIFSFNSSLGKMPNYRTIILSRGFNSACDAATNPRMVSRTVINTSTW